MFNRNSSQGLIIALSATLVGSAAFAEFPQSFADLAEEVSPAVVRITTTTTIEGQSALDMLPQGQDVPEMFREFFNQIPELSTPDREAQGLGSGFIINDGKFVVTNNHVIADADQITVETIGGEIIEAELIGRDASTDVAVLKINTDIDLTSVEFGDSDTARVGDWVMAVGNPLGQDFTVTTGIISARHRSLNGQYDDFLQTDAAINRGNSGGPLLNMDGEVIGVNTAIVSPTGGSVGLGFSMSSNVVEKVVDQIIEFGEARRGWLGVGIEDLNDEQADALGLKTAQGALINSISEGSPAEAAGFIPGDVILKFGKENIETSNELVKVVGNSDIDKTYPVQVYRQSENDEIELEVTLGKRPEDPRIASTEKPEEEAVPQDSESVLGMKVTPLDEETAQAMELSVQEGLIINEVDPESQAAKRGLRPGDVIVEINQQPVSSAKDVNTQIDAAKDSGRNAVMLLAVRGNRAVFIALPIE